MYAAVSGYILKETNALYGLGPAVTPSTKSCVDGRGSPGTTEKLKLCSRVAIMMNMLLLANVSPIQRCLPVKFFILSIIERKITFKVDYVFSLIAIIRHIPILKGKNFSGGTTLPSPSRNLSGRKFSGSPQDSSISTLLKLTMSIVS